MSYAEIGALLFCAYCTCSLPAARESTKDRVRPGPFPCQGRKDPRGKRSSVSDFPYFSPARIRSALRERGGAPLKRRGQNFLTDPNQVRAIVARILERTGPGERLLEIGPGLGALTFALLAAGRSVRAVEIDPVLAGLLEELLADQEGLELVRGDAREVLAGSGDWTGLVCGNLPYYITTELLLASLELAGLRGAVFLVQDEFARRLEGGAESSLAVFAGNRCAIRRELTVPPGAFFPAPEVKSSLIVLDPYSGGPLCSPAVLERLLRATYRGKRKTIRNNWKANAASAGLAPGELFAAAERIELDVGARPEALAPETYYRLVRELQVNESH